MKIGWGWGITIFIFAFIAFILVMVVMAFGTTTELYAEDYYQQEVEFQHKINAKRNGISFKDSFELFTNNSYVQIEHAAFLNNCSEKFVRFYRSNNATLDRQFSFESTSDNTLRISKNEFEIGNYDVLFQWKEDNLTHIVETTVTIQ